LFLASKADKAADKAVLAIITEKPEEHTIACGYDDNKVDDALSRFLLAGEQE
jgi:hypothetical protein